MGVKITAMLRTAEVEYSTSFDPIAKYATALDEIIAPTRIGPVWKRSLSATRIMKTNPLYLNICQNDLESTHCELNRKGKARYASHMMIKYPTRVIATVIIPSATNPPPRVRAIAISKPRSSVIPIWLRCSQENFCNPSRTPANTPRGKESAIHAPDKTNNTREDSRRSGGILKIDCR